jgi:Tol biopolymer transport system component
VWRSGVWRTDHVAPPPNFLAPGQAGLEQYPTLSPDAQQLAFSWNGAERRNFDIYIKELDGGRHEPVRLTSNPAADLNPAWSPDGFSIAFVRQVTRGQFQVLTIPALGGQERSIATCQSDWDRRPASYLAWTPDGRGLMVLQRESRGQTAGVLLFAPNGLQARRLVLPVDGSPPTGGHSPGAAPCLAAG